MRVLKIKRFTKECSIEKKGKSETIKNTHGKLSLQINEHDVMLKSVCGYIQNSAIKSSFATTTQGQSMNTKCRNAEIAKAFIDSKC